MIKRTLLVESPCSLSVKNGQILYRSHEEDVEDRIIPLEDVGYLMIENPSIIVSARLMSLLSANGTAVIFCDLKRMPCAMLQPFAGHSTHAETVRAQISASRPLCKRLWQDIVRRKIRNQAQVLALRGCEGVASLYRHAVDVKSGDSDNREAVAARAYWKSLFGRAFKRDADAEGVNALLNYGYAVLRAAAARALTGSGLYCAIGLHHGNRYNAFCLADDFMEPYRPFVDHLVCELLDAGNSAEVTTPIKQALLGILTRDVFFDSERRPLMNGLSITSASLGRCLSGDGKTIDYPMIKAP